MPLAPNIRLGRYEVRSKIGEGGMGEVYLARDPKLGREVAIKVLPASFSADAERLARFEQEACAAGALNHPNILSVYDVGTENGGPYVVSELLEGESLREKLSGGPPPQRKVLDYASQIARGLAAAHERGIVHRDLKPENVFITSDGRAKILDFGLAKLTQADGDQAQTGIPTRRVDTDPGAVMGTAGYMAPEQVRGQKIDHRADIFSFGCILYEMLTGRRAFRGESAVDTLSAILKEDPPDLSESNRHVSPALERLVLHCMEKSPAARFHSTSDLAFALEALSGSDTVSGPSATVLTTIPERPKDRERLAWVAVSGVLLLSTLAFAALYFRRVPAETTAATRFHIAPPEKSYFGGPFAVSPDGRRLILRAITEGKVLLWVRALDSLTAQPLAGTEEAVYPFWSPDSRFIGFFSGGKLKKMEATGGPVQTLCDAPEPRGGTWNADGVIVFTPKVADVLYRVSAAGGAPVPVTTLNESRKEDSHFHPQFLPDGRHFLYYAYSPRRESTGIYVGSLDSKETKLLVNADASAAYAPPGYLLFMRERTLMAQGFDADKLESRARRFPSSSRWTVSGRGVPVTTHSSPSRKPACWFTRAGVAATHNSSGSTGRANNSVRSGRRPATPSLGSHLMRRESRSDASSRRATTQTSG